MPLRCEGPGTMDACSEPSLFLRRTFTPPIAGYNGPPVPSSAVDLHAVYLAAHSAAVPSVARAPAAGFGFEVLTTSKPWIYILRKAPPPKNRRLRRAGLFPCTVARSLNASYACALFPFPFPQVLEGPESCSDSLCACVRARACVRDTVCARA